MPPADTLVVLLARAPRGAKSRLSDVLDDDARTRLALAMVEDTVACACGAGVGRVVVATESAIVSGVAARHGAETLAVPARGTREAAAAALASAAAERSRCAVVLPADLPTLGPDDVRALCAAAETAAVVVAPDRHRRGTNALALTPPLAIAPLFGAGSFSAHRRAACRAGLRFRTVVRPGLALDVDTPDDLRAALAASHALGPRTATVLADLGAARTVSAAVTSSSSRTGPR